MDVLDNGVCLCNLAKVIQQKAEECVSNGTYTEVGVVDYQQWLVSVSDIVVMQIMAPFVISMTKSLNRDHDMENKIQF